MSGLKQQLRIIGGKWRGRTIRFPDLPTIRPTPDRVRETLFNWLQHHIQGACCLDLFAGSGALGFEALSRGAAQVTMVDQSARVIEHLRSCCQHFKIPRVSLKIPRSPPASRPLCQRGQSVAIVQAKIPEQIRLIRGEFDIVFLDPPFHQDLVESCCNKLSNLLNEHALIYIEVESARRDLQLPETWRIIRDKQAGQVRYLLISTKNTPFEKGGREPEAERRRAGGF